MSLISRINDFAGAVRDKFNEIAPKTVPSGGTVDQVLTKTSSTNYATAWRDPSGGSGSSVDEDFVIAMSITFGGR